MASIYLPKELRQLLWLSFEEPQKTIHHLKANLLSNYTVYVL